MNGKRRQPGLTLLETLVAVAIILTLIGVLATAGKNLRRRAEADLTRSTLEVLDTALQVYHTEQGRFVPMASGELEFEALLGGGIDLDVIQGNFPASDAEDAFDDDWRNAALYFFLHREPKSRKVLGALAEQMLSGQDENDVPVRAMIGWPATGTETITIVRVADAWGTPLDYRYDPSGTDFPGTADFPQIRSAGPDKILDTKDDLTNL